MLNRDTSVSSGQEYYSDTMLNKPTTSQSVFDNLALSFGSPLLAPELLMSKPNSPETQSIRGMEEALDAENQAPGITGAQNLANDASSMIGFMLSPVTWAGAGVGSLVGRGIAEGAGLAASDATTTLMQKPLSDIVGTKIGEKYFANKTLGGIADKTLKAFTTGAGSDLPSAITNNYNFDTNHVEWGGVATEMGMMGATAIGIDAAIFAKGLLKGKINRAEDNAPGNDVTPEQINSALKSGIISPTEHQWMMDYNELRKTPDNVKAMQDLQSRASQIVNENGQYANSSTNQVPFELIPPKDMDNLKSAAADQLTSDLPDPYKTSLSNFVAHNSLDNIRENPQLLDGIQGYVDHINEKMEAKPEKMAQADDILDKHLMTKVNENMPFSQKEVMKMMKQSNFDTSHMEHMPLTVPENLKKVVKVDSRIKQLKEKQRTAKNKVPKFVSNKPIYEEGNTHVNEHRSVTVKLKGVDGSIELFPRLETVKKDGNYKLEHDAFQVKDTYLEEKDRGKGYGKALYKAAIDFAASKGKRFLSDVHISKDAMRIYRSLEKRGYKFSKQPAYLETQGRWQGYYRSSNGKPIFELESIGKSYSPNKQIERRISELEKQKPAIMTPKEELQHLRDKLTNRESTDRISKMPEYHRLSELAQVWKNAKSLLDRVHLEEQYKKQEAFKNMCQEILNFSDSNIGKIAKVNDVKDYLNQRINSNMLRREPLKDIREDVNQLRKVPSNSEQVLAEQSGTVSKIKGGELSKDFNDSADKFDEFKKSYTVFKKFMDCIIGGISG